jgi:hypothetical protein
MLTVTGGGISNRVHGGVGEGNPEGWAIPLSLWKSLDTNSSFRALRGTEPFKDCRQPQPQHETHIQNEKLLDDGVDLPLQQKGGKKRS